MARDLLLLSLAVGAGFPYRLLSAITSSDMETVSYQVWFAVRYVHLASVTLLVGGSFVVCALCASSRAARDSGAALAAAALYEWAFWSIAGVTVATGVSNLGLKGQGLLGPGTSWGTALSIKLGAVLLLLALSLVRSDFVIRWRAVTDNGASGRGRMILSALYGLTLAVLLAALWIGLGLAHGRY